MAEEQTLTAADIMTQIAAAGAGGDLSEVIRLGNILRKQKAEIEKAETDKLQKEAEELAGARESLATKIHKAVRGVVSEQELNAVKAQGFTYKLDTDEVKYKAVALSVPTIKSKRSGGGGGTGISTKDETGMNLSELIEAYGTPEQKADIQNAYDTAEKNPGSARWQEQTKVKKEILKEHPELIRK